jgi:AraC family transcriptional activator of pobA
MQKKGDFWETLYDLYRTLGLSVDLLDVRAAFTIHNLKDLLKELPIRSPRFRPNYFNFVFIKDAYGHYTIDEMAFDLEPGMIYFTNPGNYRTFEWHQIKEAYLVTFNESFLKENVHHDIYKEFPFLLTETVRPQLLDPAAFAEFENLYLLIYKEYNGSSPYKNRIIGSLFVVLLLKVKEYFWKDYNPIYEGNRSSHIVKSFKRDLENHYRDLIGGKAEKIFRSRDYAVLQNLHPSYLSNVIKSKTGKPTGTWISEKTTAEAKSLLLNSSFSIKEIAYLLGFSEPTHFSNYFKKNAGCSPAEYRKKHC